MKLVGEVFAQGVARARTEESLRRALAEVSALKERVEAENVYLRASARVPRDAAALQSHAPLFRKAVDEAMQVASTRATVLLLGETGTGKELMAAYIHGNSPRRERTMIKLNCAALPANLIEAELFGRERGAYTGALTRQIGRFELASGSTLFLDEVGELPLELQPKLLRVLQEGEFERVGGTQTLKVDVRVIAATNRPLADEVRAGNFREDLYYRLNVFPDPVAGAARACGGHPDAGLAVRARVRAGDGHARERHHRPDHGAPARLSVAGQCSRAAQRDRTRHHSLPRRRPRGGPARWRGAAPRERRIARRARAQRDRDSAGAMRLARSRRPGCRRPARHQADDARVPHEKARHRASGLTARHPASDISEFPR